MNSIRRKFLQRMALFSTTATAIEAGLLTPGRAIATYLVDAFSATDVSVALKAAPGSDAHSASSDIKRPYICLSSLKGAPPAKR